jgi:hypothetical protein
MLMARSRELFHWKKRPLFPPCLSLLVCLLPLFLLAGCSGSGIATASWPGLAYAPAAPAPGGPGPHLPAATLRVPEDYPTISAAVKAAKPGDLISIAPGIYHETVIVPTPDLTIRGRNRNTVILDGNFTMPNGILVTANDVVLENMTVRHYVGNGFYWYSVHGYRGSYLTAYANGSYGIYAYLSVDGQFDHDYAAGQPNGFYIGACHPCNAVITEVLAENNGLGFSGTNAGGNLVIEHSIWRDNLVGIAPNTEDSEPLAPQDGVTITHNLVENNNNTNAPAVAEQLATIGTGILIAGGSNDVIEDNRVSGHDYYGILVVTNVDQNVWEPHGNIVKANIVTDSGVADLALAALSAGDNCFSGNTVSRTAPPFLQYTHACGSLLERAGGGDPSVAFYLLDHYMRAQSGHFRPRSWQTFPNPALQQPGMPDPTIAPQGIFANLGGYALDMSVSPTSVRLGLMLGGLGLATPVGEIILGFYFYLLPIALYAAWFGVGTWDVIRRTDLKGGGRIGWLAVIYLIPVLGPLAYFLFGKSEIQRSTRWFLALGAPLAYVIIAVVLLLLVP